MMLDHYLVTSSHQRRKWLPATQWVRIAVDAPVDIIWTTDDWQAVQRTKAQPNDLGVCWSVIPVQGVPALTWTFYWTDVPRWEGRHGTMSPIIG